MSDLRTNLSIYFDGKLHNPNVPRMIKMIPKKTKNLLDLFYFFLRVLFS